MEDKKLVIPKILIIVPSIILGISIIVLVTMSIMAGLKEVNPIRFAGEANTSTTILSGLSNPQYNEWVFADSEKSVFDLLNDNEAEGAVISLFDLVNFNQHNLALTMIGLLDCPLDAHKLVSKNEINSIADLVEKKIGVPEVNSPGHFFTIQILRQNNIAENDVGIETILKGSPIDAIRDNVVDAAYLSASTQGNLSTQNTKVLATNERLPLLGCMGLAIKTNILAQNEKSAEKTLDAYFEFLKNTDTNKWAKLSNPNWSESFRAMLPQLAKANFYNEEKNEEAVSASQELNNIHKLIEAISGFSDGTENNSTDPQALFSDEFF